MSFEFSRFGRKLCARSGILELMDDLGQAMAQGAGKYMLGGGNPAAIPEIQRIWRTRMQQILAEEKSFDAMLGNYDTPQGRPAFIRALAAYFNEQFGWAVTERNIAITNGSQNAFFYLFNLLAGEHRDGSIKKVVLPLIPEYIGYADQSIAHSLFAARRPVIEDLGDHTFKYHVDFEQLQIDKDAAMIAVSRPTNPTGNVLGDLELHKLALLAKKHHIPLLVDNAYGAPFPNIIFSEVRPTWDRDTILTLSLSKLGLPGTRTGIVVADEALIEAIYGMNAIVGLANGNVGQELVTPLLCSGELAELCRSVITPFYAEKATRAVGWVHELFDPALPWYLHKCEGALFLWLWLKDLPIPAKELYQRLKERGVIVVPGDYFFYGMEEDWQHRHECLRLNYSQPGQVVREGLRIVAEEVRRAYG